MKRTALMLSLLLFVMHASSQQVKHVVIVTIDGFRPDFYLDSSWHTPTLKMLMKQGAYAKGVTSAFPSMTYPSHTTIITSVPPAKHGVFSNNVFEPQGSTGKMYWNDSSIKSPTIWKLAKDKGLTVAALFWPVSANAPVDYNIPDIGSMGERVRADFSKPARFIDTVKAEVFNDTAQINYGRDENVGRIAAYVIKEAQPNLMTVHLFSVDHSEHMEGRDGPMVREAIADADSAVAIIINSLQQQNIWDSTVLIVAGDHGFVNVTKRLNLNVWLAQTGLINNLKTNDWKAQFFSVTGSAYLYLKDKNDSKTLNQVKSILNNLPDSVKHYFRVIDREQIAAVGGNPDVALALSGTNGGSFGSASVGAAIEPGKGGAHGYYPDFKEIQTGFIAVGPAIKQGSVIEQMNLKDIAPVVCRLLGLQMPTAEGKVPDGLLK